MCVGFSFQAHKGMLCSAKYIKKELDDHNVLDKAFTNFPEYNLVITGSVTA